MSNKWVYRFNEVDQAEKYVGGEWENVRGLLGGKGANLAEMTRIEVPVPPGFTITTEACNAYLSVRGNLPGRNVGPGAVGGRRFRKRKREKVR